MPLTKQIIEYIEYSELRKAFCGRHLRSRSYLIATSGKEPSDGGENFQIKTVGNDFSLSPPRLTATALQMVVIYFLVSLAI